MEDRAEEGRERVCDGRDVHGWLQEEEGKIVVDSGAAENVMPWSWLENSKTISKQEGIRFVAANGGAMGNYGRRVVEFEPAYEEEAEEQGFKRHA